METNRVVYLKLTIEDHEKYKGILDEMLIEDLGFKDDLPKGVSIESFMPLFVQAKDAPKSDIKWAEPTGPSQIEEHEIPIGADCDENSCCGGSCHDDDYDEYAGQDDWLNSDLDK